jgi:ribosomal-protein-serine acetyltransferase
VRHNSGRRLVPFHGGLVANQAGNLAIAGFMLNRTFISIRRFEPDDVASLFWAARESMEQLQQWMAWCRADYSLDDTLAFVSACDQDWEADRKYSFAIYDQTDGTLMGSVGLSGVNRVHSLANVGYWVRSSCTGRGAASVGVRLAALFAFEQLQLNRLELLIALGNHASIRVAEKVGAQREGVLRDRLRLQGRAVSAVIYSLVARDIRPNHNWVERARSLACVPVDLACRLS